MNYDCFSKIAYVCVCECECVRVRACVRAFDVLQSVIVTFIAGNQVREKSYN